MISSEFKRFEVDQRQTPVESDLISILEKMLKQRKDSLDQFRKAERNDLAPISERREQRDVVCMRYTARTVVL